MLVKERADSRSANRRLVPSIHLSMSKLIDARAGNRAIIRCILYSYVWAAFEGCAIMLMVMHTNQVEDKTKVGVEHQLSKFCSVDCMLCRDAILTR